MTGAVARAMAEGALQNSRADIALSVTGFAGPAGEQEEEGLCHFACARRGRPIRLREGALRSARPRPHPHQGDWRAAGDA
ncbi:CinA family protein [uncultured Sphingomonas sp.]|uniref:CinA family protein n=1 Tax=uncultured Sphingomonas sp. TaxID=158754 RepID=UPI0025EEFB5F|nr:CinA family protein [uncultured Sphingomonas sp.]